MHFFLILHNTLSVVWIPSYNLFSHGVNFSIAQKKGMGLGVTFLEGQSQCFFSQTPSFAL